MKFDKSVTSPLASEKDLPTLLAHGRQQRPSKSAHFRRLAPESKSAGDILIRQMSGLSIESSKTLGACDRKLVDVSLAFSSEESITSDPGPKAFPVKAEPLKRWRAAAKIQGYLAKWRKGKKVGPTVQEEGIKIEIGRQSPRSWVQYWPDEFDAPTPDDLNMLTELESMLIEDHGTMPAAYKFIINCVKNPGNAEPNMTSREFRIALHLKASKEGALPSSPRGNQLDRMFDKLLALLRKTGGEISKAEFLRFPELLEREKALRKSLVNCGIQEEDILLGSKLRERLQGPISGPEEVRDLFKKSLVALELEPARTTNLFFQLGNAPRESGAPNGLTLAIQGIMQIARQFGGLNLSVKPDVLVAGWTLCNALAKQVIALGAPMPSTPDPSKNRRLAPPSVSSKSKSRAKSLVTKLPKMENARKYLCRAQDSSAQASKSPNETYENECKAALWKGLPTDEVLWSVGRGAEVLNHENFKTLLRTAWDLFDSFDAVDCLMGPVGWGRMRPKLDALAALNLQQYNQEDAQSDLQSAVVLLQQIASMCEADPRLARIAALYGATFLADRIRSTANSYANFDDERVGCAVAQANRGGTRVTEVLELHVEELLGGRKVACCLSSGEFQIVPAATAVANPLAEFHQSVTAAVLANATSKRDTKRNCSQELNSLKPVEKYLLGYGNLQGL
eukprot:gnl/MRDRNA2_/MRDRNA2_93226_c0_seq1.p1 gnl/MRDRNA2_/MRDRNA2_93226_c0~~gnl/MRDRNA2_/MRDRNA2_93226_c0_seq1.p1  ORF type:complete len:679 (+),score=146.33 gnl/MRDRNA2_/MRDRNA2_93226_c0_seq1:88-2124(+)